MRKKWTYQDVFDVCRDKGFMLLTKESDWEKYRTPLTVMCKEGHVTHGKRLSSIVADHGCRECKHNSKWRYIDVKKYIKSEGSILLTKNDLYKNMETPLELNCPNGHQYFRTFHEFYTKKRRCTICGDKRVKYTTESVREWLQNRGFILISNYEEPKKTLMFKCERGHILMDTWNNIMRRKGNSVICKVCKDASSFQKPDPVSQPFYI